MIAFNRVVLITLLMGLAACGTGPLQGSSTNSKGLAYSQTKNNGLKSMVIREARKQGVPVNLALAVVQIESRFNPRAVGRAGEVGLMQIKPRTARGMGFKGSRKALFHPETNIKYGMKYLAGAYKRGGKTICGAILKYNAGHYAKRMNPTSARYCRKVKKVIGRV
ncbi:lytic transglycosylase domain-containing protein [Coralliovum pocilloporae]|uniref:lytic transglycosylase domain-containing protein n=1 Tax=Coralliovum pocilloporae TaxID=3066369 RepID=UPI003306F280